MSTQADRRTALLDAALRVIGRGGLRAATHRAVEQEAGAPHGSTTYYFKTRDQLIEATVEHLVQVDRGRTDGIGHAVAMALARRDSPPDWGPIADAIADWVETDREIQLARFELMCAGGRDERIRRLTSEASARFWQANQPVALAAGSPDPERDGRVVVAMLDGLIFDHLTRDPPDREILRAGIERILSGTFG